MGGSLRVKHLLQLARVQVAEEVEASGANESAALGRKFGLAFCVYCRIETVY